MNPQFKLEDLKEISLNFIFVFSAQFFFFFLYGSYFYTVSLVIEFLYL